MNPLEPQETGQATTYVVLTFHANNRRTRTWHTGNLASCRAWITKYITPYAGKTPAPIYGIFRKETTWVLTRITEKVNYEPPSRKI